MKQRGIHYARVSDRDQVHGASLDQQQDAGRAWAGRAGVDWIKMFREEGESGRSLNRTTLKLALDFIRSERRAGRRIDVFVVHDLSRFCRNLEDQLALQRQLRELGVRLDSVMLALTDDAHGRAVANFIGASNQLVVELQGEKIRDCMLARKRQGRWPHRAPIGYRNRRSDDGSRAWVEPDPQLGPIVRAAFEAAARGELFTEILAMVAAKGLRVPKAGRALGMDDLRHLFANPFYIGKVRSQKYGFTVDGEHEPLVDAQTWQRVAVRLAGKRLSAGRTRESAEYPLRGFVRCDACGRPLTAYHARGRNGTRYAYYQCWAADCHALRLPASTLEQRFLDALATLRLEPESVALIAASLRTLYTIDEHEAAKNRHEAQRRITDLTLRRDRVIDAYLHDQTIDRPTYDRQLARIDQELARELEPLAESPTASEVEQLIAAAKPLLTDPCDVWRRSDFAGKRTLQALIYPAGLRITKDSLRTTVTASIFGTLRPVAGIEQEMVEQTEASTNQLLVWLRDVAGLMAGQPGLVGASALTMPQC